MDFLSVLQYSHFKIVHTHQELMMRRMTHVTRNAQNISQVLRGTLR